MNTNFNTLDIPDNMWSYQFTFTSPSHPLSTSSPSTCGPPQKDKFKKPKRNKSAFILFSSETRKILKAESGGQINSNEMMVKLADLWRDLDPKDKEKYYQQADQDKERYLEELNVYLQNCPTGVIKNKTKKNHIKKPCSSYAIFVKEMKEVIKGERPELKMADILKVIAERWKKLTDDEKAIYQEKSRIEKEVVKAKLDENFARDQIKTEHLMEDSPFPLEFSETKENQFNHQHPKKTSNKRPLHHDLMLNDITYKCLKTEEGPIKDVKDVTLSTTRSVSNSEPVLKVEDTNGSFALDFPDLDFQNCDIKPLDTNSFFNTENDGKSLIDLKESKQKKTSELLFDLLSYDLGRQRSESFMGHKSSINNNFSTQNDTEKSLRRDFLNKAIITALKRTENDIFKQESFSDPNFIDLQL